MTAALDTKGYILYNLGSIEEAIKFYNKALEIDPNFGDAWSHKGLALEKLRKRKYSNVHSCVRAYTHSDFLHHPVLLATIFLKSKFKSANITIFLKKPKIK